MLEEKIEKDKNRKKENKKLEEKIEMVRIEKDKNKYKAEKRKSSLNKQRKHQSCRSHHCFSGKNSKQRKGFYSSQREKVQTRSIGLEHKLTGSQLSHNYAVQIPK